MSLFGAGFALFKLELEDRPEKQEKKVIYTGEANLGTRYSVRDINNPFYLKIFKFARHRTLHNLNNEPMIPFIWINVWDISYFLKAYKLDNEIA